MADLKRLETALRNANAAGDMAAVEVLAGQVQRVRRGIPDDYETVGKYATGTVYKGPDGNNIFVSPEMSTSNQEQIANIMANQPRDKEADAGTGEGVARSVLQGATFGFGDEMVGNMAAAAHPIMNGSDGSTFAERRDAYTGRERQRNDKFAADNPKTALAAEIGGGVMTGGAMAAGGATAMTGARTAPALMKGAAIDGAGYGAISGAGYAKGGIKERAEGAAKGAATGAAIGAGGAAVMSGGGALARAIKDKVKANVGGPTRQINARLEQAARNTGMTREQINARVQELGPEGMLVDAMGENGQALARSAANTSPAARETLETAVKNRTAGQPQRLTDALLDASSLPGPRTLKEIQSAADKTDMPAIRAAYEQARAAGQDIDPAAFDDVLKTSAGASAHQEGTRLARDRMVANAAPGGGISPEALKAGPSQFDILNETKKSLDARAAPALGQGQTNEQAIAGQLAKTVRERIDANLPEYGGARAKAQHLFARKDAMKLGAEGAKPTVAADFARNVEGLKPELRADAAQGYAAGKIDKLQNSVGKPGTAERLFGAPRDQEAMKAALGAKVGGMQKQLDNEAVFSASQRGITGNSTTARQLHEMGSTGAAGAGLGLALGGDMASMGMGTVGLMAARKAGSMAISGLSKQREAQMAPIMASIMAGRELPAEVVMQIQKDPVLKSAILRTLSMQGGAAVAP